MCAFLIYRFYRKTSASGIESQGKKCFNSASQRGSVVLFWDTLNKRLIVRVFTRKIFKLCLTFPSFCYSLLSLSLPFVCFDLIYDKNYIAIKQTSQVIFFSFFLHSTLQLSTHRRLKDTEHGTGTARNEFSRDVKVYE